MALVAGTIRLRRAPREPLVLARVLPVIVVSMLGASLITMARVGASRKAFDPSSVLSQESLAPGHVVRKPDIFYIILDRFGSNATSPGVTATTTLPSLGSCANADSSSPTIVAPTT